MKREKFCEFVRGVIALPVMLVLLFVMWNAFCHYANIIMAAMNVRAINAVIGHLIAFVLVFSMAKPIYAWFAKALRFLIR